MKKIFSAYVYNENGLVVAIGASKNRDRAIRRASKRSPINQGILTIKVMELEVA